MICYSRPRTLAGERRRARRRVCQWAHGGRRAALVLRWWGAARLQGACAPGAQASARNGERPVANPPPRLQLAQHLPEYASAPGMAIFHARRHSVHTCVCGSIWVLHVQWCGARVSYKRAAIRLLARVSPSAMCSMCVCTHLCLCCPCAALCRWLSSCWECRLLAGLPLLNEMISALEAIISVVGIFVAVSVNLANPTHLE